MEISNKVGRYILIGIGASIIIAFLYGQVIIAPKFEKKGRYTIGYIYQHSPHKGGATIYYKYKVGGKLYYSKDTAGGIKKINCLKRDF